MKYKYVHQEWLKLLACVTMLVDHLGAIFFPRLYILRLIGRIAFPLYCFLLTQGMEHTWSRAKYLLRLAITAVLSEWVFDVAFFKRFTWEHQSVMVTLFLGAVMLWGMEGMGKLLKKPLGFLEQKNRYLGILAEAFAMGLVFFPFHYIIGHFSSDYGWKGIFLIALMAVTRRMPMKNLIRAVGMLWLARVSSSVVTYAGLTFHRQTPAILALLPIALYSGKKITHNKALQWSFQLFYPAHLLILWLVSQVI